MSNSYVNTEIQQLINIVKIVNAAVKAGKDPEIKRNFLVSKYEENKFIFGKFLFKAVQEGILNEQEFEEILDEITQNS